MSFIFIPVYYFGLNLTNDGFYRNYLRNALSLCTSAQDNHLRALVLALVAARYMYTAREHAEGMLRVCETLGAGVGAGSTLKAAGSFNANGDGGSQSQSQIVDGMPSLESQSQSQGGATQSQSQTQPTQSQSRTQPTQTQGGAPLPDQVGNARLRYWVGERLLGMSSCHFVSILFYILFWVPSLLPHLSSSVRSH